MVTHEIQTGYLNWEEVDKARLCGYYDRTQRVGVVREHDRTMSKKVDRTNRATNIVCDGTLVLSDIPKYLIFRNADNNNRYITNLCFKPLIDNGVIYMGTICVDIIPRNEVLTDPNTGKKYINTRFKKLDNLDTFMNTHQLVIITKSGAEIEIGKFKEWVSENGVRRPSRQTPPSESPGRDVSQRQSPDSIDGIRF